MQTAERLSDAILVQATKSHTVAPQLLQGSASRASMADRGVDSLDDGADESTLHYSPLESAASFEHAEYVSATKPSVSVELAIGYAIAVFQAAQLATKSLAAVGSNVI